MKMNRLMALLLAFVMLLGLCSCGTGETGEAVTSSVPEASVSVEEEAPAVPEEPVADAPAADSVAPDAEEPIPPIEISYPIEGDYSFIMMAVMRNVTAQVFGDNDYSITPVYQAINEATGVSLEFIMLAEATVNEKISVTIASGDFPDVFNSTLGTSYDNAISSAYNDGIVIDMAPLLEENAPDYLRMLDSDPARKKAVFNPDGTLSQFVTNAVPFVSKGMLIRNDWLEDLGLEMPSSLEDLTEVLQAFKSEKGATMPLLCTSEIETGLTRFFNADFSGFRGVNFQLTTPDSGEMIATFASENYIDYLLYLADIYEQGLLTSDFLSTGREYGNYEANFYSGVSGVWQEGGTILNETSKANASDPAYDPQPFALTDMGDVHISEATSAGIGGKNFISTACEYPEILMQFFNYCYTEPGQKLVEFGVEGISYEYDENGKIQYTELITNNPEGWAIFIANAYYTGITWLPTQQTQEYVELSYSEEALKAIDFWTETSGDTAMKRPAGCTLNTEETEEFNALAGDILTVFQEAAPRVIMGELTEEDYRNIIEEAHGMGLTRMTEIYQGAYDRYLENA